MDILRTGEDVRGCFEEQALLLPDPCLLAKHYVGLH